MQVPRHVKPQVRNRCINDHALSGTEDFVKEGDGREHLGFCFNEEKIMFSIPYAQFPSEADRLVSRNDGKGRSREGSGESPSLPGEEAPPRLKAEWQT